MDIYSSLKWRACRARVLKRDGKRCTVGRLLGGSCSPGSLHAHHIVPVAEGGELFADDNVASVCSSHHPQWEALRRTLVGRNKPKQPRCPHEHRTAEGRRQCEARMARRQLAA